MLTNGAQVALTQTTEYPWDGDINIKVEPTTPSEFAVMLRIPAWARRASVRVHSASGVAFEQAGLEPGKYFLVSANGRAVTPFN